SDAYGVCLDTGNPLSVGQEPVEAARRLGPLIRHVHLKDYTVHFAPEGYRLVRCAAGEGCVDFPAILEIVRASGHDVLPRMPSAPVTTGGRSISMPGLASQLRPTSGPIPIAMWSARSTGRRWSGSRDRRRRESGDRRTSS